MFKKLFSYFFSKKKNNKKFYLKYLDCESDTFYEGPGGGSFGNITCTKCGSKYNNLGPFGLERI